MIALFTDFGWSGPYVGLMKARIMAVAPAVPVVDLMHDAPAFNPRYASYLLSALVPDFPADTIFVCVVDPGVGTDSRRPCILQADGRWFIGPDNGLFTVVAAKATHCRWREILWRPDKLSNSFHGRDLFAPVAARLALGEMPNSMEYQQSDIDVKMWPRDLAEVIYQDHYGNCMTGLHASEIARATQLRIGGMMVNYARTFATAQQGELFWYENSLGLVEFAVREGAASGQIKLGSRVEVVA